jgi:hypothetical protein
MTFRASSSLHLDLFFSENSDLIWWVLGAAVLLIAAGVIAFAFLRRPKD